MSHLIFLKSITTTNNNYNNHKFEKTLIVTWLYSPCILWLFPGTGTTEMEDTGRPVWDETLRSARCIGAKTEQAETTASCLKTQLSDGRRGPSQEPPAVFIIVAAAVVIAGDQSWTCSVD